MRRRLYVAALAALCVYCLTDALAHGRGETVRQGGARVFLAEIPASPILPKQDNRAVGDQDNRVARDAYAVEPPPAAPEEPKTETAAENATPPAEPASAATAVAPVSAAAPATIAPVATTAPAISSKAHAALVAPRVLRHRAPKAEIVARSREPAEPVYEAPASEPPVQRIAAAPRGPGGCSGPRWSRPDAAGVPVLLCN